MWALQVGVGARLHRTFEARIDYCAESAEPPADSDNIILNFSVSNPNKKSSGLLGFVVVVEAVDLLLGNPGPISEHRRRV